MSTYVPILMYHNIVEETTPKAPDWVGIDLFRQQIRYIIKKGFTPVSPHALLTPKKLPQKPIIITFDDGYEGVYTYAFPLLKELNIKTTVFLITSCLSDEAEHLNYWSNGDRPLTNHLSLNEIKEMLSTDLITIGCHSHSHKIFRDLSSKEVENEVVASLQLIKDKLNKDITIFSYPGGYIGQKENTYNILKKYNIQLAFGAQSDRIEKIETIDYLNIHRINIMNENNFTNPKSKHRFESLLNPYLNKISRYNKLNFLVRAFLPLVK